MSEKRPALRVVFIWHQHQPFYKDFDSGIYVLPWVRLHGVKDYLDMVRILDDFPKIKQVFNLVPSLIEQIDDYARNDAVDSHMALTSKPAADLTDAERTEIVSSFFSANVNNMIQPHLRYYQLYEKAMSASSDRAKAAATLSDQDFIDLAIWSNLAWIDPMFRSDPEIAPLFAKKRDFAEEDKQTLIAFHRKLLQQITPAYREAQNRGQIEVSFSPYFHPILPLLIDTELAREAMPRIQLPDLRFSHPEDAEKQISMSCDLYKRLFERELRGMWPSEGSVAEQLIPMLLKHGIKWIATDEEVFYATTNHPETRTRGLKFPANVSFRRPYQLTREQGRLGIIFRDHTLSDKIGFVYSGWDAEKAADDFVKNLLAVRSQLKRPEMEKYVLPIILDGDNAWEYYKNDGADFLRALYTRLSHEDRIETVTASEVFDKDTDLRELPYLFAGSWINHNFKVWIGHEQDNRAWDLLSAARNALVDYERANPQADPDKLNQAWKEIYVAEGSDWCWWYGDDHSSDQDYLFDRLFRSHLSAVYKLIGKAPPEELLTPIRGVKIITGIEQPVGLVSPKIDGLVTSFYEWHDAGMLNCLKLGSAMHRAVNVVRAIHFGFDDNNLYFRLDLVARPDDNSMSDFVFQLELETQRQYLIDFGKGSVELQVRDSAQSPYSTVEFTGVFASRKIIELSIPRGAVQFDDHFNARIALGVYREGEQIERWPSYGSITTTMPTEERSEFWQV
jgi:alpha-amylase/alpha-mannosidase (GH57 family)